MIAKIWQKVGLIILIIACLFNIVSKIVAKVPYMTQLQDSAQYVYEQESKEEKK